MHIVIEKNTKKILLTHPADADSNLNPTEVYPGFDPEAMEVIRTNASVPAHFRVNENNECVWMTIEEQIAAGVFQVQLHLLDVLHDIDALEARVRELPLDTFRASDKKDEIMEQIESALGQALGRIIAHHYRVEDELKITKGCLEALLEGSKKDDPRRAKYLEMQNTIRDIKTRFDALKLELRQRVTGKAPEPAAPPPKRKLF